MKNNAIILDLNILKEVNLSLGEFILIYSIYQNDKKELIDKITIEDITIETLQQKRFIKIIDDNIILREKAIQLINFLSINCNLSLKDEIKEIKKSDRKINEEVIDRIDEFRNKWKGLKVGSMGSTKACKDKLTRWIKENPEYSFDDILKAAELYINSMHGNYKYLQQADYFIFKKDGSEESSRLSAFIDDIDQPIEEDWTSKIN